MAVQTCYLTFCLNLDYYFIRRTDREEERIHQRNSTIKLYSLLYYGIYVYFSIVCYKSKIDL